MTKGQPEDVSAEHLEVEGGDQDGETLGVLVYGEEPLLLLAGQEFVRVAHRHYHPPWVRKAHQEHTDAEAL